MPPSQELDKQVVCIKDLQNAASEKMSQEHRDYYNGGAMDNLTLGCNETAFNRYLLRPRTMRDVSNIDTRAELWGKTTGLPLGISPSAMHRLVHADGEVGTSKACAARKVPMILSALSNDSLEDVAAQSADAETPYAIQISPMNKREVMSNILARAKAAGYKAVVLTVDAPMYGRRLQDARNGWDIPRGQTFPNLTGTSVSLIELAVNSTATWQEEIAWIRSETDLEVWVKGVTTKDDLHVAIQHGVDGVIISNHGGRQLDTTPASIDILREVAPFAKGKIRLAMDGGVHRGSDIFKAIALGAEFVFVGKIAIWGLAYNGSEGVGLALDLLMQEFKICMGLSGCAKVSDISPSHLSILDSNGMLREVY